MKMLNNIKVLTTDAQSRIGLYAIQYLGKAGADVAAIGIGRNEREPVGFYSKYLKVNFFFSEKTYGDDFREFLKKNFHRYDIINPISTSSMRKFIDVVSEEKIECNYLLPKIDSLNIADNKELLTTHAQKIGLLCPKTFYNISPEEVHKLTNHGLSFPAIIKFRGDNRITHWNPDDRYSIVRSNHELTEEYNRMHEIENYPIIQEYINGFGCGFFALYNQKRKLKAHFCHKRIREYPISGGPSSCCESFYDEDLIRIGRLLFESLDWTGLGMVEFKYDTTRGRVYIIEVNPRYWGSLPLAVQSGVNFPVLHALLAVGEDFQSIKEWKMGVKVRFINKDIWSIFSHIKNEKGFLQKFFLFYELINPKLKDGLAIFDDFRPIVHSFFKKN